MNLKTETLAELQRLVTQLQTELLETSIDLPVVKQLFLDGVVGIETLETFCSEGKTAKRPRRR